MKYIFGQNDAFIILHSGMNAGRYVIIFASSSSVALCEVIIKAEGIWID